MAPWRRGARVLCRSLQRRGEAHTAFARDRFAELERGAGGRVHFISVMGYRDLDVHLRAREPRRKSRQSVNTNGPRSVAALPG